MASHNTSHNESNSQLFCDTRNLSLRVSGWSCYSNINSHQARTIGFYLALIEVLEIFNLTLGNFRLYSRGKPSSKEC